jgi:hypothetical protein
MTTTTHKTLVSAVVLTLVALLLTFSVVFTAVDRDTLAEAIPAVAATMPADEQAALTVMPAFTDEALKDDVLWLARVIYSETKRPDEQELVAWVVRNRVETEYRGASTYKGVVLDPWQFSAFNQNGPKRGHYMGLDESSKARGWATAVHIAHGVVMAPAYERPFEKATRHFYSEQSMVGRSHPEWATGQRPVALDREIDPRRFRFYSAIS